MEVRFYVNDKDREPVRDWLEELRDRAARVRIKTGIDRLGLGNFSGCKSVGDGVHELKIDFGPGYRLYFGSVGDKIILLLNAGTKKNSKPISISLKHIGWNTSYWATG